MIAFDFDGTLVDSMPGLTALACAVAGKYYERPLTPEQYQATSGLPFAEQMHEIYGWHHPDALREFAARKVAVTSQAPLLPRTVMGLLMLRFLKVPTAVVSSTVHDLVADRLRDVVWYTHAGAYLHVAPEPLLTTVLGLRPEDPVSSTKAHQLRSLAGVTLFVGDSARDERYAAQAGVRFLRYQGPETWTSIIFHASQTLLVAKQTPGVPTRIWP